MRHTRKPTMGKHHATEQKQRQTLQAKKTQTVVPPVLCNTGEKNSENWTDEYTTEKLKTSNKQQSQDTLQEVK